MPRVLSYTPPWLNRPAPGYFVFAKNQQRESEKPKSLRRPLGPRRTIARRATEVFVANENELRWTDLVALKQQWENEQQSGRQDYEDASPSYRTLKVPVANEIRQLSISPSGAYIAIATTHTVHIAILPDSSHLATEDDTPLKLKTFQLGPTDHVLETSPAASILWHPFGVNGSCLVTVTEDATVRLWELDRDNRWSFNRPALAVDLKKLANGNSSAEDFSPSKYGINNGFSPDTVELEIASACFGGTGSEIENPWSSMTLWLATRGGDVYALCPLLPRKWHASSSVLGNLATSPPNDNLSLNNSTSDPTLASKEAATLENWLQEVAETVEGSEDDQSRSFLRPNRVSPIPRLQGPASFTPDTDDVFDISDIFVVAATNAEGDVEDEDSLADLVLPEATQFNLVSLATGDGQVHLCLDLEGVKPRWLPTRSTRPITPLLLGAQDTIDLVHIETVTICEQNQTLWSTFSPSVDSRHSFFVSHSTGVTHVDPSPWIKTLSEELSKPNLSHPESRLDYFLKGAKSNVQHPIRVQNPHKDDPLKAIYLATATNLYDSDLGNFLLTNADGQAQVAVLETSDPDIDLLEDAIPLLTLGGEDAEILPAREVRPSYQPPRVFWQASILRQVIESHYQGRRQLKENEIRLSSATERALIEAHRTVGNETEELNAAAADLFRRCQRMLDEFKGQIRDVRKARERIDSVLDDDADAYEDRPQGYGTSDTVENRLQAAKERQEQLSERCAELRRRVHLASKRPLTEKEKSWIADIDHLDALTLETDEIHGANSTAQRLRKLRTIKGDLVATVKVRDAQQQEQMESEEPGQRSLTSPLRRGGKMDNINLMLDRESALVSATQEKLARLQTMSLD